MSLPYIQSPSREMSMMQTQWASQLNPVLNLPLVQGIILPDVSLINGATTINHLLGRKLQGWFLVDIDGAAEIYRSQPKNSVSLTLTSNAAVTVSIFVF